MMPTKTQLLAGAGLAGVGLLTFASQPDNKTAPIAPERPVINLPAGIDVFVDKATRTYEITGITGSALKEAMSEKGPAEWFEHYWAYTRWSVDWQFQYDKRPGTCALAPSTIGVRVQITQTLPLWKDYATAPADLQQAWNAFDKALVAHEDHHAHTGIEAGKAVLTALRALEQKPTCEEVAEIANTTAQPIIDHQRRIDVAFDAETNHGMKDFPPLP